MWRSLLRYNIGGLTGLECLLMIPGAGKRRARFIFPGLYLALAMYVWIDFASSNHDGLANIGLFLVTLPVAAADLLLASIFGRSSVLMPDAYGYVTNHAVYYIPAVAMTAALLWLLGRAIDRRPQS